MNIYESQEFLFFDKVHVAVVFFSHVMHKLNTYFDVLLILSTNKLYVGFASNITVKSMSCNTLLLFT